MTIKIISDGKVENTRIIDEETGAQLQECCTKAHIMIDAATGLTEAILYFTDVKLDVSADVIKTIPPTGLTVTQAKSAFLG